jgi:hypothetical protein
MKWSSFLLVFAVFAIATVSTFAQGGNADPARIKFARGRSSTVLTGTLRRDQQQEYVFAAKKGQTVTITNSRPTRFSFSVLQLEIDFKKEDIAKPSFKFEIPETGDYLLYVKKTTASSSAANYSVNVAIK